MRKKDPLGLKLEEQNADDTALFKEDESASTGDDLPEFATPAPAGRGRDIPSIEKAYMPTATPEEIYEAERMMNKQNSLGELVTAKEEMEEVARLREEQEQPPGQTPAGRLPPQAQPPGAPQIPGAATQPDLNPFASYQQPQQKPESGLPYKPKFAGTIYDPNYEINMNRNHPQKPNTIKPEQLEYTPKYAKHDCLSVHGWQKHEEWEEEREKRFFRQHKKRYQ